jgi:DNA polymerase (family X)
VADRKQDVASALKELAELTVLDEASSQSFRARAYENAMHEIRGLGGDIEAMTVAELCALPGIGKGTAQKIREYLDTGKIAKLEALRDKFPPDYVELSRIPGIGPKTMSRLRAELHIESVADLRAALDSHAIRELKGFGARKEEAIGKAIERLGFRGHERRTAIADAFPIARRLVAALEEMEEVDQACYCGSLRRLRETIGDLDLLCASTRPARVMEKFVALGDVGEVVARGETKTTILTRAGLQVDLRVVAPDQFGAAVLYFTGSKAHNIKVRQLAIKRGWTLNEYGLADAESGDVVASATEEEIYRALALEWIPPSMREDAGEIEAAAAGTLPRLEEKDLRGDLHVHSTWSGDGRSPLEEVVARAAARGYQYLAITDHGEDLAMNGVSRERLRAQRDEIERLREKHPTLTILHGCELNIGERGGLDYDQDFRAWLDFCVAAVHSHFDLPQARQTERLIEAMRDPTVQVIGHLTGRKIGRRPGIEIDVEAVLDAAEETGTAVEINSSLSRLDASADVLRQARGRDVVFVVSTDAHHVSEFERTRWGTQQAMRGWVDPARVANTWPRKRFLDWAKR